MPKKGGPCGQPWHPATGHLISETKRWCASCTKDMVVAGIHLTHRRMMTTFKRDPVTRKPIGKVRVEFYAHATQAPPARTFEFTVYQPVAPFSCTYRPTFVRKTARNLEEAIALLTDTHPGHSIAEHTAGLWREIADTIS